MEILSRPVVFAAAGVLMLALFIAADRWTRVKRPGHSHIHASAAAPSIARLDPSGENRPVLEELRDAVNQLGVARTALLERAARHPGDPDLLNDASDDYRASILRLRSIMRQIEHELDADQAKQIIQMIMTQTGTVSYHLLKNEMFARM